MWGRSTPSSCAGVGGRVVPSWDVLGLGVPPKVLSSGVEVLPGNMLRSGEDVGSRDLKGPTHITVAPHIDPAALGHAPHPCHPLTSSGTQPLGGAQEGGQAVGGPSGSGTWFPVGVAWLAAVAMGVSPCC